MQNKLILVLTVSVFVLVSCGVVSATGLADSPQPKFQHDLQNTGQSQYNGPQTNTTKWKYNLSNSVGGWDVVTDSAIDNNGTIYIGSSTHLFAFNPNGTIKWQLNSSDAFEGSITTNVAIGNNDTIYYGSGDGNFYALNPNGTIKWKYNATMAYGPTIGTDGTIYIGKLNDINSGHYILTALNPDGTTKWDNNFYYFSNHCPAIDSNGTIYIVDDFYLYALNPDRTEKWNYYLDNPGVPSIGSDGTIYLTSYTISGYDLGYSQLYAINPNGTLKWTYNINARIISSNSVAIDRNNTIYVRGSYEATNYQDNGRVYAINPNGTLKWTYTTNEGIFNSITIGSDGKVYVPADDSLYALNPNGTLKWKSTIFSENSPAIGSDGTLYIVGLENSRSGDLCLFALKTKLTATANVKTGLFNYDKTVYLTMNVPGTIYYTLNGSTPTASSTKYIGPIKISSTTTLKFFAIDSSGNKSPIYTEKYTIDKVRPKITSVSIKNLATGVSRTSTIVIKFSENIKSGLNWNKFYIKNLSTGKTVSISKWISGNTLYLKTTNTRAAYTWYQVYIPGYSVKDSAGNNLASGYWFKFQTGKY
ncbi:PQQ-binding-like beta-propeller repeat protein [Methanobacterium oryzae]|uniref:chitobiase/beta-hexosaminidase C-terminal domain-containing protein n=1 Tax=Methanobacterium oryzae TaxID=69540 RepID=UPI003D25FC34